MRRIASALLPLAFSLGLGAAPAAAADFTGTWVGKFVCSYFNGSAGKGPEPGQTLLITQAAGVVNLQWVDAGLFTGVALDDAKSPDKKGQLGLADCGTHPDLSTGYAELTILTGSIDREKGTGTLKGTSLYSNADAGPAEDGTCKWSFKLQDTANPNIGGCN